MQTTESQLREDLTAAENRAEQLETDLVLLRDECADTQETIRSLRAAAMLSGCDGVPSQPVGAPAQALEQELRKESEERLALEASIAEAETTLLAVQQEVENVRKQWRTAVQDAKAAQEASAANLARAEDDYAALQRAFDAETSRSAQIPGLLKEIEVCPWCQGIALESANPCLRMHGQRHVAVALTDSTQLAAT